jgi:hypothetical protein
MTENKSFEFNPKNVDANFCRGVQNGEIVVLMLHCEEKKTQSIHFTRMRKNLKRKRGKKRVSERERVCVRVCVCVREREGKWEKNEAYNAEAKELSGTFRI